VVDANGNEMSGLTITTFGTPNLTNEDRLFSFPTVTLTEAPGVVTRQSLCVSISPNDRLSDPFVDMYGYTITTSWYDLPGHPGVNPLLINDIDMVILTDVGGGDVWWSEDGVHGFERMENVHAARYVRMVFFPYDNETTEGPVLIDVHANFSRTYTIVNDTACGTCLPGETEACVTDELLGGFQYCQLDGSFSPCRVSALSGLTLWNSIFYNETTSCNLTNPSHISRIDNESSCTVVECVDGYVFDDENHPTTCVCVPNTFQDDCNQPNSRIFRACLPSGTYGECSLSDHATIRASSASSVHEGYGVIPLTYMLAFIVLLVGV
jgi:hypothetical protein